MSARRIAVTGAAGFIGHTLCKRLLAEGHGVTAIDYTTPELPERLAVWRSCHQRVVTDLREPYKALAAIEGAEWVFHLAANVGGVGYLAHHDWQAYLDNTRMSLNVIEAATHWQIPRLFFASSSCAFPVKFQTAGGAAELREDRDLDQGTPDLMYGREKLSTLRLCEIAPIDARVGLVNSAYGPGLAVAGQRMKFPAAITRRALECRHTGEPLTVWGDGSQVRSYIYVDDVVDKMLTIMTEPYAGPVTITTSERVTCTQGAEIVKDILGIDVPIEYVEGETGVASRNCSNDKWEATYGPDKSRPFADGMVPLVRWMERVLGS
jgi:nucleoside-diphosphate-sugar epimerase